MSLQDYYNSFSEGYWADPDKKVCGCRGSGYALSDVDTWHKCPYHCTPTTRHPEDDYGDDDYIPTTEELIAVEVAVPVSKYKPLTDDQIPF
jgi:hypothetical protein